MPIQSRRNGGDSRSGRRSASRLRRRRGCSATARVGEQRAERRVAERPGRVGYPVAHRTPCRRAEDGGQHLAERHRQLGVEPGGRGPGRGPLGVDDRQQRPGPVGQPAEVTACV